MKALRVGGLTPFTTIDFPGRLAAVVWCQGCPWRCRYCHNGHLVSSQAAFGLAWDEVLAFLRRRHGLLDGVVFSGGEPTLQAALPEAMAEVRALGFGVALHTAGCFPERLARVLHLVDWIGLDIKAGVDAYPVVTGVPGSGIAAWRSLALVLESGVAHEVRVTVHHQIQAPDHVESLVRELVSRGVASVVLQRCETHRVLDQALRTPTAWPDQGQWPRLQAISPTITLRS